MIKNNAVMNCCINKKLFEIQYVIINSYNILIFISEQYSDINIYISGVLAGWFTLYVQTFNDHKLGVAFHLLIKLWHYLIPVSKIGWSLH